MLKAKILSVSLIISFLSIFINGCSEDQVINQPGYLLTLIIMPDT